jgi:hypothetical protein
MINELTQPNVPAMFDKINEIIDVLNSNMGGGRKIFINFIERDQKCKSN